jgi:hypothetical protein
MFYGVYRPTRCVPFCTAISFPAARNNSFADAKAAGAADR